MSTEEITPPMLIREYTRELHNKNAAVFIGAGLSLVAGFVDWKDLLREIIEDLDLNPDDEYDLVTLAQYHCNQVGGKSALTKKIFDHFAQTRKPTENHRILSQLPIQSCWTTNYDKLIETALVAAKKVPDVKYTEKQLAVTRLDRDVTVYKMHGDVDHSGDAVISKDDYEEYPEKMGAFVAALRGDLVERTFLFLGFSFTDPNLDYILSRVRIRYRGSQRHHYSVQKRVTLEIGESDEKFRVRKLKQHYFIKDLKRFGVQTVLVDEYSDIENLLNAVATRYRRKSVFISGAAYDFGACNQNDAESFLHSLANKLVEEKYRIVTGFGLGVGGPVLNGVLSCLSAQGKTISDEAIVMRPFPQIATDGANLAEQWRRYRRQMLEQAGIAVFVFGNKLGPGGDVVLSNGMQQEFQLAIDAGLKPLPVGVTGFVAEELWNKVNANLATFFPDATPQFKEDFALLGNSTIQQQELIITISRLVNELQGN